MIEINGLWVIWGIGFGTGGMAVYLSCLLFAERLVRKQLRLAQPMLVTSHWEVKK